MFIIIITMILPEKVCTGTRTRSDRILWWAVIGIWKIWPESPLGKEVILLNENGVFYLSMCISPFFYFIPTHL